MREEKGWASDLQKPFSFSESFFFPSFCPSLLLKHTACALGVVCIDAVNARLL